MSDLSKLFTARLEQVRHHLSPHQAFLFSNPADVQYYSGFVTLVSTEREAFLLVTSQSAHLFYAHFSPYTKVSSITDHQGASIQLVKKQLELLADTQHITEVRIDQSNLVVAEYQELLAMSGVQVSTGAHEYAQQQRVVKDEQEIKALTKANNLTKQTMTWITDQLQVGQTELELCDQIEHHLKELGSPAPAFPTIVAFGAHSALPHHQPTGTKLTQNTVVLVDMGATIDGYHGDMTRTVWFGDAPTAEFSKIETLVKTAYDAAFKAAHTRPITASQLDTAARSVIEKAGYGAQFIHTTGHGVGLDIHEPPSLNGNNPTELKPQMVVTIEPGIYLDNQFGYRYENTVHITADGVKVLTV